MNLHALVDELRRRKVVRVTGAYVALGLGAIYAADVIMPRLGLPDWTVTLVIVVIGLGLPLAVGLAWAFDITPEGVVRTEAAVAPRPEPSTSTGPVTTPAAAPSSTPSIDRRSIVVLPFSDLSPARDNEHFSDGLTEEIIADLSGVGALRVISRSSSMRLKGTDLDVRAIGRDLGVRYALEGSVRKAGTSLRITAQLIDTSTDGNVWAVRYDGVLDDIFDLQERVAREIVEALDVTLTSEEDARLADHPVRDVRAFELFVRARDQLGRYDNTGVEELLARAIAIEGETPPLRALRGWAKVHEVRIGVNRDMAPLVEAEREARALLADAPDASYGHALLGYVAYERGTMDVAVRHFRAALEIEPNDEDSLFYCGIALQSAGQIEEAQEVMRGLLASDPLSPLTHVLATAVPWFAGRAGDGLASGQRALELDPHNAIARWGLGYTLALVGRAAEAEPHAAWMMAHAPATPYTPHLRGLLDALEGEHERALERIATIDLATLDSHKLFHISEVYAVCGEADRALDLLESAVEAGFYPYDYIDRYCPLFDAIRGSERFAAVAARAKERMEAFDAGG